MQAGRHWRFRRVTTRSIGASGRRFPPFFDGGCEHSRAATHVDACDGVFSDAGSTPAASTNFSQRKWAFGPSVPAASTISPLAKHGSIDVASKTRGFGNEVVHVERAASIVATAGSSSRIAASMAAGLRCM